jgi:putrescine importer
MPEPEHRVSAGGPRLKRALGLWDLVLFGMIVIQPTAPLPVFGVLSNRGQGHVVTSILLAMVAMICTAMSYGLMARAYPSAGSAFTYVGQEFTPVLGYITGWSMVMDYLLNPIICVIWCSKAAMNFVPVIPYWVWVVLFVIVIAVLNLRGIDTSAKINATLVIGMGIVVLMFFVFSVHFISAHPHSGAGFFTRPFYDPSTFRIRNVLGGTSIAVLTYIGFDGISTLSEEAQNPRRNILVATVLTCVLIGLLSAAEVYAAQLIWPCCNQPFQDVDTGFVQIAARAGGVWFAFLVNLTLLIASFGSGLGAQLGAARLLYGMGRSNALPRAIFGQLDAKRQIPRNGVLFSAAIALVGAFAMSYELGAEMLNFGALLAFMGVNAAALMRYYVRASERRAIHLYPPVCGFLVCGLLWLSLSSVAKIAGSIWMLAGIAVGAWRTHGFQKELVDFGLAGRE